MFLSLLTLLQTNIPCSVNFYRYKTNYEKYLDDSNGKKDTVTVKQLSSPQFVKRLSPIRDLSNAQGLNLNPEAQNGLLKYAMNNKPQGAGQAQANYDSDDDDQMDVSKFDSKNKIQDEKAKRKQEIDQLKKIGMDAEMKEEMNAEAVRGSNKITKMTIDPITGTAKQGGKETDGFASPTSFLMGGKSPPMSNFMAAGEVDCVQFEGEMIRKASETKLKKYWYCLLGKELYVYKNR